VWGERNKMIQRLLLSMVAGILIPFFCFSPVVAEELVESSYVGCALGLGPLAWTAPTLKYKNTSIGDIKFPCQTEGLSFSTMFFLKGNLTAKHRTLIEWDFSGSWIQENGTKRWSLQGYPATAESEMKGFIMEFGFVLHYLKVWKIWLGSGIQMGVGGIKESFRIDLKRQGQDVAVFDPTPHTESATRSNYILLAATILEGHWGSWDIHFGHSDVDVVRHNEFGGFRDRWPDTKTHTSGLYVRIRKLIPLNIRWNRVEEAPQEI